MTPTLSWLVAAALLTMLQWVPYIANRALLWGLPTFLGNYPEGYPATEPEPPPWAARAKRAHLNMVETLPAFAAVVLAAELSGAPSETTAPTAAVFVVARALYAIVYTAGIPFLRTPVYLVSWGAVLFLCAQLLLG